MRSTIVASVLAVLCLTAPEAQAQSGHPILGTWKENRALSTSDPGPLAQSAVNRYEVAPDGFIVMTRSAVTADGSPQTVQIAFKLDGRRYPIYTNTRLSAFLTSGTPSGLTAQFKAVGANGVEMMTKDADSPVDNIRTWTVSADGRSLTETVKGTNGQGQTMNNVVVFDRVAPTSSASARSTAPESTLASAATYIDHKDIAAAFAKGTATVVVTGQSGEATYRVLTNAIEDVARVEVHDSVADLVYITGGTATLVTGGTPVSPTEVSPGEHRASSLTDGESRRIGPGDLIVIPRGVPHLYKDVEGDPLLYVVVKVG